MKVLITGAGGALGGELGRLLSSRADHFDVVLADRNTLDITQQDEVAEYVVSMAPEVVINCAAYNDVIKAESGEGFETAVAVNGFGVAYLIEAVNKLGAKFVHFSTNYVFNGTDKNGYRESDPVGPVNKYGLSKAMGEGIFHEYCKSGYLIRTGFLYGQPGSSNAGKKSFVDIMLEKARAGEDIRCVNDQFGQPTSNADLARAVMEILLEGFPFGNYHITNYGRATRYDWAQKIFELNGLYPTLTPVSFEEMNEPVRKPQHGLLVNTRSFVRMRSWEEALADYFEDLKLPS